LEINKKNIVALIVCCLLTAFLTYKFTQKEVVIDFDKQWYENRQAQLKREIDSLNNRLSLEYQKMDTYNSKIDSIENVKQKIKYIYVKKYKEIDSASVGNVIGEFDRIFSDSGVK